MDRLRRGQHLHEDNGQKQAAAAPAASLTMETPDKGARGVGWWEKSLRSDESSVQTQAYTSSSGEEEYHDCQETAVEAESWEGLEGEAAKHLYKTGHIEVADIETVVVLRESAWMLLDDVVLLTQDARLIAAGRLLDKVEAWAVHEEGEEGQRVMARIASDVTLQRLRRRLETVARVQAGEKEGQGQGWVSTGSLWGVANDYRKEGDGSLTVRLKGTLQDASVWDQLCVMREGGLYHTWLPLMRQSSVLHMEGKESMVLWYLMTLPLIGTRDLLAEVFVCDHMDEGGVLLFCGRSIDASTAPPGLPLPPKPKGWNSDRMDVSAFHIQFRLLSTCSYELSVVTNIRPRLPLLQPVISLATKLWGGVLPHYMHRTAKKVSRDPLTNPHAQAMRRDWVYVCHFLPRLAHTSRLHDWPMVATTAFDLPPHHHDYHHPIVQTWAKMRAGLDVVALVSSETTDDEDTTVTTHTTHTSA